MGSGDGGGYPLGMMMMPQEVRVPLLLTWGGSGIYTKVNITRPAQLCQHSSLVHSQPARPHLLPFNYQLHNRLMVVQDRKLLFLYVFRCFMFLHSLVYSLILIHFVSYSLLFSFVFLSISVSSFVHRLPPR